MKTKAAILVEQNKSLVVDDIEIPSLGIGQVLVQLAYAGICGAQVGEIKGNAGEDKFLPHLMGHEGAGVVRDVGKGTKLKEGDHVVAHWREGKGIDADFPKYKWKAGKSYVGAGKVTTFQEYSIISENRLTKVNTENLRKAASMGCSITTAFGLINNEANLKIGQSIMVIGCGGVGLNIIQAARLTGANEIRAVDVNWNKLNIATSIGATSAADFVDECLPSDIVVDTTGISVLIEQGWKLAKEKMILVGQPHLADTFTFRNARKSFYSGKIMMDSQGGLTNPNVDIPRYLDMGDKIHLDNTALYTLENINQALEDMGKGKVIKPMLEML